MRLQHRINVKLQRGIRDLYFSYSHIDPPACTDISLSALSKASTCSAECSAESVTRKRELPTATVGGRMATTKNPRAANCSDIAKARDSSPTIMGWIGEKES